MAGFLDGLIARTFEELSHTNTLVVGSVRARFQIAPGVGTGLGIAQADYQLLFNDELFRTAKTDSQGEVEIPLQLISMGTVKLKIFGTEYVIALNPPIAPLNPPAPGGLITQGQRDRLDLMGYFTGYLIGKPKDEIILNAVGDPLDSANVQQAILNFQTDNDLTMDGDIGSNSTQKLRQKAVA